MIYQFISIGYNPFTNHLLNLPGTSCSLCSIVVLPFNQEIGEVILFEKRSVVFNLNLGSGWTGPTEKIESGWIISPGRVKTKNKTTSYILPFNKIMLTALAMAIWVTIKNTHSKNVNMKETYSIRHRMLTSPLLWKTKYLIWFWYLLIFGTFTQSKIHAEYGWLEDDISFLGDCLFSEAMLVSGKVFLFEKIVPWSSAT